MKSQTQPAPVAHTPTPWHITTNPHNEGDGTFYIVDGTINAVSVAQLETDDSVRDEANAAFIVRACNAHDGLVDCLTDALEVIGNWGEDGDPQWAKMAKELLLY